tara:strand:- start:989 stop:1486 length:498 start_codon:yes stop_codon:yes gene_type:complete
MAIKDLSRKPYIEDNKKHDVKIGIATPVSRGTGMDGYFAASRTTIEAVKNNIRNLLNTERGERIFQPTIGINLKSLLFSQIDNDLILKIQDEILDTFQIWLPFVEVHDIKILSNNLNSNDINININTISIVIIFNIKEDPSTLSSITVPFTNIIGESGETEGGGY